MTEMPNLIPGNQVIEHYEKDLRRID